MQKGKNASRNKTKKFEASRDKEALKVEMESKNG
jgi:hypothetical protein